jgi:hypothetical protein
MNKLSANFDAPEMECIVDIENGIGITLEGPQLTHLLKLAEFYSRFDVFQAGVLAMIPTKNHSEDELISYR